MSIEISIKSSGKLKQLADKKKKDPQKPTIKKGKSSFSQEY